MSTFPGPLKEFPGVSVDRFDRVNIESTVYFLTHCHSDHMVGLRDDTFINRLLKNDSIFLYCSTLSKEILLKINPKLSTIAQKIIGFESSLLTVPVENYKIKVSCIPAGHCPGSVMFLFETRATTVLYTGDFRIDSADIQKFKLFHFDDGTVKHFNKIYLDTTFMNPNKYFCFPRRTKVIKDLVDVIQNWLSVYPMNQVLLEIVAIWGSEGIIVDLASHLNLKIHVDLEKNFDIYKHLPVVLHAATRNCSEARIHVCMQNTCSCIAHIKMENRLKVRISCSWYQSSEEKPQSEGLKRFSHNPNNYNMCYATHPSYSELKEFLNYLKPKDIYPCTKVFYLTDEERDLLLLNIKMPWAEKHKESHRKSERKHHDKKLEKPLVLNRLKLDKKSSYSRTRRLTIEENCLAADCT